ncbi:uncharacterized protein LOC117291452 [Asterias rubens]|uniref:uncharacterized protein LOC117291452 n=1 Tax=Asterias rubens TaxID=7604 RepID=UPI00145584E4|nr:uncharacterized protein LOC117291452 [Asterias rubens]XP_033629035.1 uncharacterized protein LOC117291452 [Asterias rubens]
MAESESNDSTVKPSSVTMVTSLDPPPSEVMEAVNQSNQIIPALFALPSESGDSKKLKLCKRVGWLRDGVFSTGFTEINIKEAKQKGIFSQPRHVTLVQGEDSLLQSQVIQGQKAPSAKQLRSLVLSPGTSTVGLITARGNVIPKRITVFKNNADKLPGKMVALGKAPSSGTSAKKAETSADTATGHQNPTEDKEVAKSISIVNSSAPNVQDSGLGWQQLSEQSLCLKESVQDQKVCMKSTQKAAAPTGEPQSCPAKTIHQNQKCSPRITRAKSKERVPSEVNNFGSPRTDTSHFQSRSNPKLDLLKMDIDFSRHSVLRMEGLIQLPSDSSPSESNCLEQKKRIQQSRQNFSAKVQEALELRSQRSKQSTTKHLENQITSQSENKTIKNLQFIPKCSHKTLVHAEPDKKTGAVRLSEYNVVREVVRSPIKHLENQTTAQTMNRTVKNVQHIQECSTETLVHDEPDQNTDAVGQSEQKGIKEVVQSPTKHLENQTIAETKNRTVKNVQHIQQWLKETFVHDKPDQITDTVGQSEHKGIKEVVRSPKKQAQFQKRKFDEACSLLNYRAVPKLECTMSGQPSCDEPVVKYAKGVSSEMSGTLTTFLGPRTDHSKRYGPDPCMKIERDTCNQLSLGGNQERNDCKEASSQNNKSLSTNLLLSPMETLHRQTSTASHGSPVSNTSDLDLEGDGNDCEETLSISETNNESLSLLSNSSVDKTTTVQASEGVPLLQIGSVYSLSAEEAKRLFPKTSNKTPELVKTNQSPEDTYTNIPISSTGGPSVKPAATKVMSEPLDFSIVSQPSQSQTSAVSIQSKAYETVSANRCSLQATRSSSSAIFNSTNTSINVHHTTPWPSVVCINGQLLKLVQDKAPKNPMEVVVIAPPNATHNVIKNFIPQTLRVSHEQASSHQPCKTPATSGTVPFTVTVTVAVRDPKITSVPVQSTPLFHHESFGKCNTTFIPTSVHLPTTASDLSCSTSVCTSVSSTASVGLICSTDTNSIKKPTRQEMSTRNPSESEGQRRVLVTTSEGKRQLISFPSTAMGLHILSQVEHPDAKEHQERSGNVEIYKNLQSVLANRHKGVYIENATTSIPTTQSLGKSLKELHLTHSEDYADKCSSSNVTNTSSDSDSTPESRPTLPQTNNNHNKSKQFISLKFYKKDAGLSLDVLNEEMRPSASLNTSQKGTTPVSHPSVRKRGRPPSAFSHQTFRRSTTPPAQPKVSKRLRTPATPLTTNYNDTTPSSQPKVSKRGRPLAPPVNRNQNYTTRSSQPNVSKNRRTPATLLNPNQKGSTPLPQSNVRKRGRPPTINLNTNRKGTTPSPQLNDHQKRRTQAVQSNTSQKGVLPSPQSTVSRRRNSPEIPSKVIKMSVVDLNIKQAKRSYSRRNRNSTSPAAQSSLKKTDNSKLKSHGKQTSSPSMAPRSVFNKDTTISSLSDVHRGGSSTSYVNRENRLIQLKRLMKQKEQDIEDMKKLRQLEVRQKLSDPDLCDL